MPLYKLPKIDEENKAGPVNNSIFLQPPVGLNSNKRVSFTKWQNKDERKLGQKQLPSCLISRTPGRMPGGANNPAERNVGRLPRTDSECQFNAPGFAFLREQDTTVNTHEIKMSASIVMKKELKNKCDFFPKYVDPKPFKDQNTQTLYRESSAQTLPYLPEVSDAEVAETLELFSLPTVLCGDQPPGLHEVEILDRARKRWSFSNALKIHYKRMNNRARKLAMTTKYKAILEAFEWEQWIEREEYIQECQMMRLNIVIKMFDKREREMHAASKSRIESACERIEQRRQAGLRKNEIEFQRGMRRLELQVTKTPRKWVKQTPMQALGSSCSEFYGPMMRHGVDPARRNFETVTGRKAFDMRIDDLEKRVNMRNLKCPFRKLKDLSKPKEYVREYEQNFCNEANLQKLFESLKALRSQVTKEKEEPKCLRKRRVLLDERTSWDGVTTYLTDLYDFGNYTEKKHEQVREEMKKPPGYDSIAPSYMLNLLKVEGKLQEMEAMLNVYEGSYIGWVMQFLSEEMTRLSEQRKLHFFTILAQKERWRREAAEAGLRQKENELRMMYEELFQQSNIVNNNVSNEYIGQILRKDMYNLVEGEAAASVTEMAKQIDADIKRWLESFKLIQNPLTFELLRHLLAGIVSPDLEAALKRHESVLVARHIVEDVIFPKMWTTLDPFDIATTMTSDLISRLIDDDLYLLSSDSESEGPHRPSWHEANAIIRKLIRQAVPGNRWKEETERIVAETYNDLFDDVFANIFNPPPIRPSDLVALHPTVSHNVIKMSDDIWEREESQSSKQKASSGRESEFISMNILSLLRKFKFDNVTRLLENLDVYRGDEQVNDSDFFLKSITLSPWKKKKSVEEDIFSMRSSLCLSKHSDLKSLKGRGYRVMLPSGREKKSASEKDTDGVPMQTSSADFINSLLIDIGEDAEDLLASDLEAISTSPDAMQESSTISKLSRPGTGGDEEDVPASDSQAVSNSHDAMQEPSPILKLSRPSTGGDAEDVQASDSHVVLNSNDALQKPSKMTGPKPFTTSTSAFQIHPSASTPIESESLGYETSTQDYSISDPNRDYKRDGSMVLKAFKDPKR
ncbi:uncharacterized protein [Drosophila kikkawai]|uniref:Cilia- and flagella-associated protein 91 n=1 Tax=Drosophila kikkawai TaxID=30033 RepID=A0A6P4JRC2_DROKI|nr:uncharacterized protein LOC108085359 [Drosophila kikkawai]